MNITKNIKIKHRVTITCVTAVIPVISNLKNTPEKTPKNEQITNYSITRNFYNTEIINELEKNYGSYGKLQEPVIFLHRRSAKLRGRYIYFCKKYISPFCRMWPVVTKKENPNGIPDAHKNMSRMRRSFEGIFGGRV